MFCSTNAHFSSFKIEIWSIEWLLSTRYLICCCGDFNLGKLCSIPTNNLTLCLPRYFGMKLNPSITAPLLYSNNQIANWQRKRPHRKLLSKSTSSPVITKTFFTACVSINVLSLLLLLLIFVLYQMEGFCGVVGDQPKVLIWKIHWSSVNPCGFDSKPPDGTFFL